MGNQLIYSNAHNLHLQYHGFSLPHDLLTLPLLFFPEICFKKNHRYLYRAHIPFSLKAGGGILCPSNLQGIKQMPLKTIISDHVHRDGSGLFCNDFFLSPRGTSSGHWIAQWILKPHKTTSCSHFSHKLNKLLYDVWNRPKAMFAPPTHTHTSWSSSSESQL